MDYQDYLTTLHWERTRTRKLKEANGKCEKCGRNSALEVHHLSYDRLWAEEMTDLQVLCAPCHRLAHGIEVGPKDYKRVDFVYGWETERLHNMLIEQRIEEARKRNRS